MGRKMEISSIMEWNMVVVQRSLVGHGTDIVVINTIFHLKYRQTSLSISAAISGRAKENSIY